MLKTRLVIAVAAISLPLVYAPAAGAAPAVAPLTLIVLNPDGTPAVDAVAVARVAEIKTDGAHQVPLYTSTPDASGVVKVTIPLTDPYIRSHYPEQKLFDIDVDIFTFKDPLTRRVEAYHDVKYTLNLGDPDFAKDFAGVDDSVVELVAVPERPASAQTDAVPPFDNCPEPPPAGASACMRVSHPADVSAEQVVIAHNIGAGVDMRTQFLVVGTSKTGTSTVSGVDGLFVEAKGMRSLSTSVTDHHYFESSGVASVYEDAALYVAFVKVETRLCWATGCSWTTDYEPDGVLGRVGSLLPTSEPIMHDRAQNPNVANTDCTLRVENYMTHANGITKSESWTFGFDFQGQYKVFTLHAMAVTTNNVSESLIVSYKWRRVGSTRPFHHVFVPAGHVSTGADAASLCPHNSPGSAYTDAGWVNKENPRRPDEVKMPEQTPAPVKEPVEEGSREGSEHARRCEAAPERCGREWR